MTGRVSLNVSQEALKIFLNQKHATCVYIIYISNNVLLSQIFNISFIDFTRIGK